MNRHRRRIYIPLWIAVAVLVPVFTGCTGSTPLAFRPPEGHVIRHAILDVRDFDFETSKLKTQSTIVYDLRRTPIDGRPGRNRVALRRYDFEAEPWNHPAVHGRPGVVAAMVGQEFKVDVDRNYESKVIHMGGKRGLAENFNRIWAFSEEGLIFPGFYSVSAISEGKTWSGKFENGTATARYEFRVGQMKTVEGSRLYDVEGDLEGIYALGRMPVQFEAKFRGVFDATNAYFPEARYEINGTAPQMKIVRTIEKASELFSEYTLPPVEESGLSPHAKPKPTNLVIDGDMLSE